jgi:LytS/YehU family sensor histidine kinase
MIPFVLITLVENIFKHADLSGNNKIDIVIEIENGRLRYNSSNKKNNGPKELSTGIGLNNIKKRLDIAYDKNYSLDIKEDESAYTTELIINKL